MNNDEYHSLTNKLSNSMLKVFMSSRRKYHSFFVTGSHNYPDISRKSDVMVGDIVHQVNLEKRDIHDIATHYPEDCYKSNHTLHPTKRKEFDELMRQQGKVVLKDDDYHRVIGVCNAIGRHPLSGLLKRQDIVFEKPIFWTDVETGIDCRAKPDFMYEDDNFALVYDLKVTGFVEPSRWSRVANKLSYWLQDAHYSSGLAHISGKPVKFVFFVCESHWPFRIARYEYDQISRERASEKYVHLMRDLKRCTEEDKWSEDWETDANMLTLSPWEVDLEDELEGFDE